MVDSPWIITHFRDGAIVPASASDMDFLRERYSSGAALKTRFSQPRSLKHHNLYWAVLRKVVEVLGHRPWHNAEGLDAAIKARLGMYGDGILLFNGEVRFELQSISWTKMDQGAFKIFFEDAMNAIGEATLLDMGEVLAEVKGNVGWSREDEDRFHGRARA